MLPGVTSATFDVQIIDDIVALQPNKILNLNLISALGDGSPLVAMMSAA